MYFEISGRFSGARGGHGRLPTLFTFACAMSLGCILTIAAPRSGVQSQASAPAPDTASPTTSQSATPPARQGKTVPLDSAGRINLIRGLSSESAVAKVPLPRGKHGIVLNSMGKIDQSKARQELKQNGLAINPGSPVEITKVIFDSNRLVFEINGGGKSGTHWYQHIEVGMGTTTAPVAPVDPNRVTTNGSYITLRFSGRVPNLTVDQAKLLLADALDFSRHSPTVLYSPAVPPPVKEAIKNHKVLVGMNRDAVLSAKGPPDRKVRENQPDGSEKEDWIYGLPPHVLFVTFDGDNVVSVQQY